VAIPQHGPVLIVDDDPAIRDGLCVLLETKGHSATTAANGAEALAAMRAGLRPCLIVLDLMMPVQDGIQFREEQRRDTALADIPVVILSARSDCELYVPQLGAVAYISKSPLDTNELMAIVRQHCVTIA
jgi:CheY-like chemotaxis protein